MRRRKEDGCLFLVPACRTGAPDPVRAEGGVVGEGGTEESRIILATGSYLGEGFDDARLDTLFLTLPISWRGRLVQYAGRLHRRCDGKREVRIYDYLDQRVAMCAKMFNRRSRGYRDIGYDMVMTNDSLNWRLDIPFGPNSYMEVDLLCKEKKVTVEIDGAFHFEDAEHYRRDRRKDFLLQKNGYLVVRFLVEDVTKRLPQVVEEISAALACHAAQINVT